jgi:hypothetical protein
LSRLEAVRRVVCRGATEAAAESKKTSESASERLLAGTSSGGCAWSGVEDISRIIQDLLALVTHALLIFMASHAVVAALAAEGMAERAEALVVAKIAEVPFVLAGLDYTHSLSPFMAHTYREHICLAHLGSTEAGIEPSGSSSTRRLPWSHRGRRVQKDLGISLGEVACWYIIWRVSGVCLYICACVWLCGCVYVGCVFRATRVCVPGRASETSRTSSKISLLS